MPYLHRSFPQKIPTISGSFAKRDLQFKASCAFSPPYTGCRRYAGCLIFLGHFLQKSPIISGSFAKREASYAFSPPYTGCGRYARCLIFLGHFLQKSPILNSSFAESDLQLQASYASLPPCSLLRSSQRNLGSLLISLGSLRNY